MDPALSTGDPLLRFGKGFSDRLLLIYNLVWPQLNTCKHGLEGTRIKKIRATTRVAPLYAKHEEEISALEACLQKSEQHIHEPEAASAAMLRHLEHAEHMYRQTLAAASDKRINTLE